MVAPLGGVVSVAAFTGRTDVALGAALSGAVAAIGLAGGLSLIQGRGQGARAGAQMAWALLVPAALAVFMVGMSGEVTVSALAALAVLGAAILPAIVLGGGLVGSGVPLEVRVAARGESVVRGEIAVAGEVSVARGEVSRVEVTGGESARWMYLGLGVLVALLAGWAAVEAVSMLSVAGHRPPAELLAATVLGPAAVMPLISHVTGVAREGDPMGALGTCVGFSAASCLGLPALAGGIGLARTGVGIPFPVTLWRVECVLLLVLSVLMVPLAAGRFVPRRRDGGVLLGLYLLYLVISALSGLRMA